MANILGTLLAFAIVFFIVTFVHEFGHFMMAKLFGVRVKAFSFGYRSEDLRRPGRPAFVREAAAGGTGTDYKLSLLPIICYVQIEGEGAFEKDRPLPPDDMMAKTRWQRFLIMVMGSVMNFVLAVVLMSVVSGIGTRAVKYMDEPPVIGWVDPGSPAEKAGLRPDDLIVRIAGREVRTWKDVYVAVGLAPDQTVADRVRARRGDPGSSTSRSDPSSAGRRLRRFQRAHLHRGPDGPAGYAGGESRAQAG